MSERGRRTDERREARKQGEVSGRQEAESERWRDNTHMQVHAYFTHLGMFIVH